MAKKVSEYEFKAFFQQPGINISGICEQAGVNRQYIKLVLSGIRPLTDKTIKKMLPTMRKYGFGKGSEINTLIEAEDARHALYMFIREVCAERAAKAIKKGDIVEDVIQDTARNSVLANWATFIRISDEWIEQGPREKGINSLLEDPYRRWEEIEDQVMEAIIDDAHNLLAADGVGNNEDSI